MRLNIGCGNRRIPGYTGIDATQREAVDIVAQAHQIPLPDACADEVIAIHLLEHLHRWEAPMALAEWSRLLRRGGVLVMEMPDVIKCCRNLLEKRDGAKDSEQLHMWGLYGDPRQEDPFMAHRWAWTFATVKPLLVAEGFTNIVERRTRWHNVGRGVRDFRVEATKA